MMDSDTETKFCYEEEVMSRTVANLQQLQSCAQFGLGQGRRVSSTERLTVKASQERFAFLIIFDRGIFLLAVEK